MTYSVDVYNKEGKVVSKLELNKELFSEEKINKTLIQEFYLLQLANARVAIASTKDRSEVAGSGRKLYRQKGTGNARVGDKNSPVRRHGGVAFGPTSERNFEKNMTKKARKLALNSIISLKAQSEALCGLQLPTMEPKTKDALNILANLGLQGQKVLLVLSEKTEGIVKSFRNIEKVKYILVDYLNPRDVLNADKVVFVEGALYQINKA
ncbi:MAG: 50S ribosomal protein L4 [Candidatus Absconditabacteria bacterium]|nr:50S ribosomal protein L4 [Candidatus Absconditabacteria bacterium]MDD3868404.1 50S ribosomal protein L4 [Candidatus Absconditabacteria bacterium]MDD4714072.1 50S ribosomal protein L4 [Candidatus Absconditabacteria bacterium]